MTVVVSLSELFAEFGSAGDVDETDTRFTIIPWSVGFTVMVMVATSPAARVPRLHVMTRFAGLASQVPFVVTALENPAPLGRLSVTVTPCAGLGPALVT